MKILYHIEFSCQEDTQRFLNAHRSHPAKNSGFFSTYIIRPPDAKIRLPIGKDNKGTVRIHFDETERSKPVGKIYPYKYEYDKYLPNYII